MAWHRNRILARTIGQGSPDTRYGAGTWRHPNRIRLRFSCGWIAETRRSGAALGAENTHPKTLESMFSVGAQRAPRRKLPSQPSTRPSKTGGTIAVSTPFTKATSTREFSVSLPFPRRQLIISFILFSIWRSSIKRNIIPFMEQLSCVRKSAKLQNQN
jgi:hypothetical protein